MYLIYIQTEQKIYGNRIFNCYSEMIQSLSEPKYCNILPVVCGNTTE